MRKFFINEKNNCSVISISCAKKFLLAHYEKCKRKLGTFDKGKSELEPVLVKLIYYSLTKEEFEDGWKDMLDTYKVCDNIYLKMMYNSRKMWVPVFLKKVFCPFIKSTGRSEGINSVFKDYIMRKDIIETFLEQYQLFQEDQQCKEYKDRFNSTILEPKYSTKHPIERHARKIYNREIYEKLLIK